MSESAPDERALQLEFNSSRFAREIGVRWGLPCITGTTIIVPVMARHIENSPDKYFVRIDCANYPASAPTGTFWDVSKDARLSNELRPWGTGRVAMVFRTDWAHQCEPGEAFYHPCDRKALESHGDWPNTCPKKCWTPDKGLSYFLNEIFQLLNSESYTGVRGTNA